MDFNFNKYDKQHDRNLTKYVKKMEDIYAAAAKEAAGMSSLVKGLSPDKMFSFDDFPATKKRIEKLLEELHSSITTAIVNGVRAEWALANNKNNELSNWVFGRKANELSEEAKKRYFGKNGAALEAFEKRTQNGLNLSDRVWKYTDMFKAEIEMGLDIGIRDGVPAAKMARDLKKYLQHPDMLFRRVKDEHGHLVLSQRAKNFHPGRGVYRSSYMNARRLAATETNIAYRTADYERWKTMDFVVGIEVKLSNNHNCKGIPAGQRYFDICDELAGKYPKEFKFTGWHPHCRCHAEPILKSEEEMDRDTERILNGEEPLEESENTVKKVPQNFNDWLADNEERVKYVSSVPYFISDNADKYIPRSFINNIGTLRVEQSEILAGNVKEVILNIKDPTYITDKEVKTALMDFADANPSLFNGGLAAVRITKKKGEKAFMANLRYYNNSDGTFIKSKGNTLMITNKDLTLPSGEVFNPLHEVKGAMKAIVEKKYLTFNQEYALESVWHEFRHAAAIGWKDLRLKTPELTSSMEVVNQFCARVSYPNFIKGLGGKASRAKKIMEKGYGYGQNVSNFRTLLKQMKVSPKSAYKHFQNLIINTPYEDIHGELVKFVELRGKYDTSMAEKIVKGLGYQKDTFQALL